MKNKILLIIVAIITIFTFQNVEARVLCSTTNYNKLKNKAYNVTLKYTFDNETHYFAIRVYNLEEGIELDYNGMPYNKESINKDGYVEILSFFEGGKTYSFDIYAENGTACPSQFLYTKKITLPKFNPFSEYEECIEYEEFPLCKKWYSGEIKGSEDFYKRLEKYKKQFEKEEVEEKQLTIYEMIFNFIKDHLLISIIVGVIIFGTTAYIIIRKTIKKKNRVKLDI